MTANWTLSKFLLAAWLGLIAVWTGLVVLGLQRPVVTRGDLFIFAGITVGGLAGYLMRSKRHG